MLGFITVGWQVSVKIFPNLQQEKLSGEEEGGRLPVMRVEGGRRRRRMLSAPDLSDITFQPVDRSLAGCEDKM